MTGEDGRLTPDGVTALPGEARAGARLGPDGRVSTIAGHTPAPWDCTGCMFPDDGMGGVYYRLQAEGMDARAANARLIAAAPTMLEALEAAEAHFGPFADITINGQHDPDDLRVLALIRAAIARATGAA